jgi:hypothetical protein
MKRFLFPDYQGWNPFQSLGYSVGTYYPPLIHYTIAALSMVVGSPELWIKIFFAISLISLPYAIYYFTKIFATALFDNNNLNKEVYSLMAVLATGLIMFSPALFSGSLRSFTQIGLITNFFTLPLLFIYLGRIILFYENKNSKRDLLINSTILIVILLSHLVIGLVSLIFSLTFWAARGLLSKSKLKELFYSKSFLSLLLPFLSVLFFFVPVVAYSNDILMLPSKFLITPLSYSTLAFGFILIVALIAVTVWVIKGYKLTFPGTIFLLVLLSLTMMSFLDAVTNRFGFNLQFYILQPYRIFPIILYLCFMTVPFYILLFLRQLRSIHVNNKVRELFKLTIPFRQFLFPAVLAVILFSAFIPKVDLGITGYGDPNIDEAIIETLDARFGIIYSSRDNYYLYRTPYFSPSESFSNFTINGQYTESTFMDEFATSIKEGIDPKTNSLENDVIDPSKTNIDNLVRLLGLKYGILTDRNDKGICVVETVREIGKIFTGANYRTLFLCELKLGKDITEVELLTIDQIKNIKVTHAKLWKKDVVSWWRDGGSEFLVQDDYNINYFLNKYSNQDDNGVKGKLDLKWSNKFQEFKIDIPSDTERPVLVKVQHHPRWRAYHAESGKEIPIYRASPNLMLVEGKGEIHFKYAVQNWEKLLQFLSAVSFLSLLLPLAYLIVKRKSL